jgi:hypothetical protein
VKCPEDGPILPSLKAGARHNRANRRYKPQSGTSAAAMMEGQA